LQLNRRLSYTHISKIIANDSGSVSSMVARMLSQITNYWNWSYFAQFPDRTSNLLRARWLKHLGILVVFWLRRRLSFWPWKQRMH